MVTTFTFARVSGAFFNPAVSLAMALTGALNPVRAVLLICVQFLGGICGAAIVSALTPGESSSRSSRWAKDRRPVQKLKTSDAGVAGSRTFTTLLAPALSVTRGLFLEMMLTAVLVLTM